MRLYKKPDFDKVLKNNYKLTPTGETTLTTEIWKTQNGIHISVPNFPDGELYPDFLFNDIEEQLQKYGINPP